MKIQQVVVAGILVMMASGMLIDRCMAGTIVMRLVGAQIYDAGGNASGQITGPDFSYQYATNRPSGYLSTALDVTPLENAFLTGGGISYGLEVGPSTFSFTALTTALVGELNAQPWRPPGSYVGLNLFFDRPTPIRTELTEFGGLAGDLTVVNHRALGTFEPADSGVPVQTYPVGGFNLLANGRSIHSVGLYEVTVTSFTSSFLETNTLNGHGIISGTFSLSVSPLSITAVPEPASIGFVALAACGLAGFVRQRRGRKSSALADK